MLNMKTNKPTKKTIEERFSKLIKKYEKTTGLTAIDACLYGEIIDFIRQELAKQRKELAKQRKELIFGEMIDDFKEELEAKLKSLE